MRNPSKRYFFTKLFNYEYWPFWVFYFPLYFYCLYLAIRSRSPSYFTAANPGMQYGGAFYQSKIDILRLIPPEYLPKTLFFQQGASVAEITEGMQRESIAYPCIAKPNVGERGIGVEKIDSAAALESYLATHPHDLLIQEYIAYPVEVGVFYHRFPDAAQGKITSIVMKEFLTVTGDGKSTLEALMMQHIRAVGRLHYLREKFKTCLDEVLPPGEQMRLEPIGNHNRGTQFLNGNHLINAQLVAVFDRIGKSIPDYYYGRFDLKVPSLDDLYQGKNIRIMELNGVNSEPAHIYDPAMRIGPAYRALFHHAKIIQQIAVYNHQYRGVAYAPFRKMLSDLKAHLFS